MTVTLELTLIVGLSRRGHFSTRGEQSNGCYVRNVYTDTCWILQVWLPYDGVGTGNCGMKCRTVVVIVTGVISV